MMTILIVLAVLAAVLGALALFTAYTANRVEAGLPPKGRFVEVAGTRLHVRIEGEGPPLLLVHGLGGQIGNFTHSLAAQLKNRYRVVMVDRPGAGYSARGDDAPAGLSAQATVLAELIDTLKLARPVVVGHSLGGAVALALALEHPHAVGGLALLAPLTHVPEQAEVPTVFKALTIATPWLRKLFAWTLATPASIVTGKAVLARIFAPDPVPGDFGTRGGGLLSLRPSQFLGASRDLQALPGRMPAIAARYPELRLPVALLYGADDRILDWKLNGEAFVQRVQGATLQVVAGGHMLPVTHAAQCAHLIDEVVQRCASTAAAA